MPRRRNRDVKGDNFSPETRAQVTDARRESRMVLVAGSAIATAATPGDMALAALAQRVAAGCGRYSVNASGAYATYHKWRWSAGELAGRYVMYVQGAYESFSDGVQGLLRKADGAERGEEYATLDKYH